MSSLMKCMIQLRAEYILDMILVHFENWYQPVCFPKHLKNNDLLIFIWV